MFDRTSADPDALVVGAGLAGLACAIHLQRSGRTVTVLEASNGVGGRVRSDLVDGFTFDRGFQVLLSAYPEAKAMLDYPALHLKTFNAGAFVQIGAKRAYIADPLREPAALFHTLKAEVGSPIDKVRIARLQFQAKKRTPDEAFASDEMTTETYLRKKGFSDKIIDRFFRPFFGGVFLDADLNTSSRMFEFVFTMLANGDNVIPAHGMGAITEQLAGKLAPGTIRLGRRVAEIAPGEVTLLDQGKLRARSIIVATEGPQAAKLVPRPHITEPGSQPVSCLYYAADRAPYHRRSIMLNGLGESDGPINNLYVPTNLSPQLAPAGRHLVSVSVLGSHTAGDAADLEVRVRAQLTRWFGSDAADWTYLRAYNITHALPAQPPGVLRPAQRPVALGENLYVCGDHRDQASINGALTSGRRAAEAVLAAGS
jgi:phytoene dehydrogenase-like protein